MVNNSYDRSGDPLVFYENQAQQSDFDETQEIGDNKVKQVGDHIYVYEAPAEDDPGRGHLSKWKQNETGSYYIKYDSISGDDRMIHKKFQNA